MSESIETPVVPAVEPEGTAVLAEKTTLDIVEIMAILPHRYPFLLIDRVIEMERKTRIVAIKNVTANEPHFVGHFPGDPVMPAVLQVEAMAQAGGALLLTEFSVEERESKLMMFTGIEGARFRRPVTPGDQLRIEVTVLNWRSTMVKLKGSVTVDGKLVSEATFTAALVSRPKAKTADGTNA
ncbi:MAG: 3-hydroxyacyl-ACP dehydratase FabZ [Acidobacteriaceae bacterium]